MAEKFGRFGGLDLARALLFQVAMELLVLKRTLLALVVAVGASACAPEQTVAAEQALAMWRNKRPLQYTYVLQPEGWSNHGDAVRIKVDQENLLEALERDGQESDLRRFTMTELLKVAVAVSDESTYTGSYDPELGYVKSFFYAPGPEEEPRGYGFDVLCFEQSLEEQACAAAFQLELQR